MTEQSGGKTIGSFSKLFLKGKVKVSQAREYYIHYILHCSLVCSAVNINHDCKISKCRYCLEQKKQKGTILWTISFWRYHTHSLSPYLFWTARLISTAYILWEKILKHKKGGYYFVNNFILEDTILIHCSLACSAVNVNHDCNIKKYRYCLGRKLLMWQHPWRWVKGRWYRKWSKY